MSGAKVALQSDPRIIPLTEPMGLPVIDPDVLPRWAADYVKDLSHAKEVDPSFGTMLALPILASTVQRIFRVRIEQAHDSVICLYTSPALESGVRKSSILTPLLQPVVDYQDEVRKKAKEVSSDIEVERAVYTEDIKKLKQKRGNEKDAAKQAKILDEIKRLEREMPATPVEPQLIVDDFTEAALGAGLKENRECLLLASDEVTLFDNMQGRFGDSPETSVVCQAFSGTYKSTFRITRGQTILNNPRLSIAISPQPGVLEAQAAKKAFHYRGVLARFLWCLPKSNLGFRKLHAATLDPNLTRNYRTRLNAMLRLGYGHEGEVLYLTLSPAAYDAWKQFEKAIEPRMRPDRDLADLRDWASKLPTTIARIAAVVHVAEQCDGHRTAETIDGLEIAANIMERAIVCGKSLIPHAKATYRMMGATVAGIAERAVQHLNDNDGWPASPVKTTELWKRLRNPAGDDYQTFERIVQMLTNHEYLVATKRGNATLYRANRALCPRSGA